MTGETKSLGKVIRDARVQTGCSLREIAKHLGISPSYQSDIENDRRVPSQEVIWKIAKALGLDYDELMALGERLGNDVKRYLRRHPAAVVLIRKLAEMNATEKVLQELIDMIGVKE